MPSAVRDLQVQECKPEFFKDCDVVFSGLDHDVAGSIEMDFLKNDIPIFSNAKNYRRDPITPLIVPLVNTSHFDVIPQQRKHHGLERGYIITNANCSTTGLVVPLAALIKSFGPITHVTCTTMQAISGGGYPGVPSLDILDNVVPYISGEEEKIEWETAKILGSVNETQDGFDMMQGTAVSAQCNRVAVIDGHMGCVSVRFAKQPPPSVDEIKEAFRAYTCEAEDLGCPSAPKPAIAVMEEEDRPQPRLDRDIGDGYAVSVGRIRKDTVLDIKFVVLSHNSKFLSFFRCPHAFVIIKSL